MSVSSLITTPYPFEHTAVCLWPSDGPGNGQMPAGFGIVGLMPGDVMCCDVVLEETDRRRNFLRHNTSTFCYRCDKRQKIIINVNKRVYSKKDSKRL